MGMQATRWMKQIFARAGFLLGTLIVLHALYPLPCVAKVLVNCNEGYPFDDGVPVADVAALMRPNPLPRALDSRISWLEKRPLASARRAMKAHWRESQCHSISSAPTNRAMRMSSASSLCSRFGPHVTPSSGQTFLTVNDARLRSLDTSSRPTIRSPSRIG